MHLAGDFFRSVLLPADFRLPNLRTLRAGAGELHIDPDRRTLGRNIKKTLRQEVELPFLNLLLRPLRDVIGEIVQLEVVGRGRNYLGGDGLFVLKDLIDELPDIACPGGVIKDRHFRLGTLPSLWNAQAASQHLRYEQL